MTVGTSSAADRWAEALASWALPDELLQAVDDDPWHLDPARFAARAERAVDRATPADAAALAALPRRGTVLDVGCGGGAASMPLADRAARCTGVDTDPEMLARYRQHVARERHLLPPQGATQVDTVEGRWPDVAADVPRADVVVCHDVVYNVGAGIDAFVAALTGHALRRVVVAMPERHPLTWLTPYFEQLHGLVRPSRPTAGMFVDVLREQGLAPTVVAWDEPVDRGGSDALAGIVARRCCVPAGRHAEVEEALWRTPPASVRAMVGVHWGPAT